MLFAGGWAVQAIPSFDEANPVTTLLSFPPMTVIQPYMLFPAESDAGAGHVFIVSHRPPAYHCLPSAAVLGTAFGPHPPVLAVTVQRFELEFKYVSSSF
jgi:hypothetical protein